MTRETRVRKWRWLRHVAWVLGINTFLIIAFLVIFFGSGLGNPLLRRLIVRSIEKRTGGRVELQMVSLRWLWLRATLKGLVIHGSEPMGTEPFLSADEIQSGLRIDSFWGRKVSLRELGVKKLQVHVRVEENGNMNVPVAPLETPPGKPWRETLLDLHAGRVQIEDSWILYNDVKTPLAIEGGDLRFAVEASGTREQPLYLGHLDWQSVQFTAENYLPIPANITAKFTVGHKGFTLEQGTLSAGRSHVDGQAEIDDFAKPRWSFRCRGWVELADFRDYLRQPTVPSGLVDVRGEGTLVNGQLQAKGSYAGRDIKLSYDDYHAAGLTSRGNFQIDNAGLEVPDFFAGAAGGRVTGRVTLRFAGLQFRAATHIQDARLAALMPEIDHDGFPIDALHWDGLLSGDTVETWSGPFQHFEISGQTHWSPPEFAAAGHQPVEA